MQCNASAMAPFAAMALAAVGREYPYHLAHVVEGDDEVRPPRELWPAFHGAFDWHSSVHGHWCLARLARGFPDAGFAPAARDVLERHLSEARLAGEHGWLANPARAGFERPYALAWVLQLAAELREWDAPGPRRWAAALGPLEALAADRLAAWLPRLPWPNRGGEHAQTAFALGLALDWARGAGDRGLVLERVILSRARAFHLDDVAAPIGYEPSGHDFLSPILGEADLMRRILPAAEFAPWLAALLPDLGSAAARRWLTPVTSPDPADGKLSHLDGLNLSRAWMLEGIVAHLPAGEPRRGPLADAATRHRAAGIAAVTGEHYAGAHWLASFVTYLVTARGLGTGFTPGPA